MPPKARKFRIRKVEDDQTDAAAAASAPAAPEGASPQGGAPQPMPDDNEPFPVVGTDILQEQDAPPRPPGTPAPTSELAAIANEGLTGKQLRTARRVALKHGIHSESDFDAVLQLRKRGIDPFRASNIMQIVETEPDAPAGSNLPGPLRTVPPPAPLEPLGEGQRAQEILLIQRDIVRRRRRNFMMLMARLTIFVFLPTIAAGIYYFKIATPFYATKSEFIIEQAESPATAGIGSMFKGTQFATAQDSIVVQGYLNSREAMARLDQDLGFRSHYDQPTIDPLQRLSPDATNEQAYKTYKRNVKIGYDPTEGIIKLEVIAPNPDVSKAFSDALIHYAEEQVDKLSVRRRDDQMQGARESYDDAEKKVLAAQNRVMELQEQMGILDPVSESNSIMAQISQLQAELQKKQLLLLQLQDNAQPNAARVAGAQGDVERLGKMIAEQRSKLTGSTEGKNSLAKVSGELRIAEAELETRQAMLAPALQQLEAARIEAGRQVRYLERSVNPVAPDEPTYPRAFENTLLAFLIFSGIYLMLSLTASILKEQATS